ncbi:hypothetical protein B0H10DRAFT_1942345 [Mycena sp. CBHHK59/15]|nr:hypothetical protein B0H10DRAFT_1942345 [Mycena sp. CBHHK59/15]
MSSPNDITSSGILQPWSHLMAVLPTASASVNVTANPTLSSSTRSKVRAPLPHSFSDPTPLRPRQGAVLQPQALVISGLENATIPSQRALTKVLAEKRIVLDDEDEDGFLEDEGYNEVWNLPDGFIMVYVCPINAHERPGIHKTLWFRIHQGQFSQLDKFAMSATVSPHHSLRALLLSPSHNSNSYRNSPALHTSPLPQGQTGTSTSSPPFLAQPLPLPHHGHPHPLAIHHHLYHHPLTQQPLVPPTLLSDLRATYSRTHMSPSLSLYASDLFSATRHHPQLDGTLLTAKSLKDAIDLARASRVIGGDLTGMELVRDDAADLAVKAHTLLNVNENGSAKHDHDLEDERDDPGTPGPPGREKAKGDAHRYQPIEVVVEEADMSTTPVPEAESFHSEVAMPPELLEVSEADIARIVPRVLTHRLRVRDGPKDEVLGSAMFPAVPAVGDDDGIALDHGSQRSTVKEILIKILAEV